jgi:RimJ/RimL family protein N-acetyltransferase
VSPRATRPAYASQVSAESVRDDELETPRLILRRWQEEDLEHPARVLADPAVMGALRKSPFPS